MNTIRKSLLLLAIPLAFQAASIYATSISLDTAPGGSGAVQHITGFHPTIGSLNSYRNWGKPLTFLQPTYTLTYPSAWITYKNAGYLLFDLSTLPFNVQQASIRLDLGPSSTGNVRFHTIDFVSLDYLAVLQQDEDLGTTVGVQVLSDLTDGTAVGTGATPASGEIIIKLDSLAVDAINQAGGLWGLGIVYNSEAIVAPSPSMNFNTQPQLILNDQAPPPPGCG